MNKEDVKRILSEIYASDNTIEDFSGFNFRLIDEESGLHSFRCMSGEGFCLEPENGDRWKHQLATTPKR